MKAGKAGFNYIQKASTRWRTHLQHVRMMSAQWLVKLLLMATLPTISYYSILIFLRFMIYTPFLRFETASTSFLYFPMQMPWRLYTIEEASGLISDGICNEENALTGRWLSNHWIFLCNASFIRPALRPAVCDGSSFHRSQSFFQASSRGRTVS